MSAGQTVSATAYARAIERRLAELAQRPIVLSPRDFALITAWHARAVPLELVREALEAAVERRGTELRALAQVAASVEESFGVLLDGRAAPVPAEAQADVDAAPGRAAWKRLALSARGSALAELLESLLARLHAGADPAEVDLALERDLPRAVDAATLDAVRQELRSVLEPYRDRMSSQALATTWQRAVAERLRQRLGLPRLGSRLG